MPDNIEIQNQKPLRELVYYELRNMILRSEIKPNTRLKEIEMAGKMGVSRTPVREAIRKLEIEGLVEIQSRRGAFVADMSVKDTLDILDVRATLEGLAARRAAESMRDEEIKQMQRIADGFTDAVQSGDTRLMIQKDEEFHNFVVLCTGNLRLIQSIESLQELVLRFRYMYYSTFNYADEMSQEHSAICQAIRDRNPGDAEKAAYSHIEKLKNIIKHNHTDE